MSENNTNYNRGKRTPPYRIDERKYRRKNINKTYTVLMTLVAVIFFIFVSGNLFIMANRNNAKIMTLEKIDVRKSNFYKGLVIRDENVYTSNIAGYLNYSVRDLEKVKSGQLIFEISDKEKVDSLNSELDLVNENLFSLQKFREDYSIYKKDIDNIEKNNQSKIETWTMDSYKDIYELSVFLNDNNNIRNQIIFSDTRVVDSGKAETKSMIQEKIDTNISKNYSKKGGVVSYYIDDMEEHFTPDMMNDITKEQTKMDGEARLYLEALVSPESKVMKIVESNVWYIGTYIPSTEAGNLLEGTRKTIYVEDSGSIKELETVVHKVANKGDDKFIIFEIKKNMINFIDERNLNVTLKTETFENIKIPSTAIVSKDMIAIPVEYIIKTDKNVVIRETTTGSTTTVPIIIDSYDANGEFAYLSRDINGLKIGDVLVTTGEIVSKYEIKSYDVIKGVYKVNNGTSKFEKINENENIQSEEGYLYILPTASLKEHDKIIVVASDIEENQIVQ